jgi:hypothetical protein
VPSAAFVAEVHTPVSKSLHSIATWWPPSPRTSKSTSVLRGSPRNLMGDSRDALSGAKPNKGSPVSVLRSLLHKPVSEVVDESGLRKQGKF